MIFEPLFSQGVQMAKSINRATLLGNVGADPEVRATSNGGRVATVSLATTRTWNDASGQKQEKTQWHRVILWNAAKGAKLADITEKYVKKGDRLLVEGEIEYRSWEDAEGVQRYSTEINARDLTLLSPPPAADKGTTKKGSKGVAQSAPDSDELPY
jgi:single-strand DNA-binding protein